MKPMKKSKPASSRWGRIQAIRAISLHYQHAAEPCQVCLSDLAPTWVPVSPAATTSFLLGLLGSYGPTHVHQGLWGQHYGALYRWAQAGYGHSFMQPRSRAEWELATRLRADLAHFAAAKQQALSREVSALRALPRADYLTQAGKVAERYNTHYLQAEASAALAAAQTAEAWPEIERRAFLYPNLRYITAGDERVRDTHRVLDDQVHPVSSTFWDTYYPPNDYRCRCRTAQTDAPVTGAAPPTWKPGLGFRHNPGRSGRVFDDTHPYYAALAATPTTAQGLYTSAQAARAAWQSADTLLATSSLAGASLPLPNGATLRMPAAIAPLLATPTPMPALRQDALIGFRWLLGLIQPHIATPRTYTLRVLGHTFTLTLDDAGVLTSIT